MSQTSNSSFMYWLTCWFQWRPHQVITRLSEHDPDAPDPYLLRWYIVPYNRWFKVFIHKFMRDDEDRALHDHPWDSVSFLFKGSYREIVDEPCYPDEVRVVREYHAPALIARRAEHRHRIELIDGKPAWTLFITGAKRREWGFYCPQGWKHWKDFVHPNNGCGE